MPPSMKSTAPDNFLRPNLMHQDHIQLSPCSIPVVMQAVYGPQRYNYTCYFAKFPGFSGGYAFVDPDVQASISIYSILTEQRPYNSAALEYLLQNYPDLLL